MSSTNSIAAKKNDSSNNNNSRTDKGVVVCFTGISNVREKERLVQIVHGLGGECTREFDVRIDTHLVAYRPIGDKYWTAVRNNTTVNNGHKMLRIVKPSWLEESWKCQTFVDETDHEWKNEPEENDDDEQENRALEYDNKDGPDDENQCFLEKNIRDILSKDNNDPKELLFASCHFHIVGFNKGNHKQQCKDSGLFQSLTKLLRRCRGTIYWELDSPERITHILCNDGRIDRTTRASLLQQCPGAVLVSPMWVLDSYRQGKLVEASRYPPKLRTALHKVTKNVSEQTQQEPIATTAAKSSLFLQGTVFVLCRISPPHYAVDFESNQLEALIRRHGGSLLSSKVVQILQNDKAKNTITNSNNKTRRSCYVICWGGATLSNAQFQTHFAQVQKQDLCDIFAATPIWLQTCVSEQRLIPLHRHPELFLPYDDNKPMHRFPSRKRKKNFDNEEQDTTADCSSVSIRISVTGWSGTKRTAIIHLIEAMGPGAYDDAMRTNTTHLICKEPPSGAKYEKAMEWNIPVVSVEWLYHVAKHGYLPGSEEQFSV